MPFISVPGLKGKVYVPEAPPDVRKKHNCPDCYTCQMCCDDRCGVCRRQSRDCKDGCRNKKP